MVAELQPGRTEGVGVGGRAGLFKLYLHRTRIFSAVYEVHMELPKTVQQVPTKYTCQAEEDIGMFYSFLAYFDGWAHH